MNNLSLRQLRYLDALATQRHFGRAAEVCAISQPALSMQIRELEGLLGAPLFERRAQGLHLTPFGAEITARAREILHAVAELGEFARGQAQGGARLALGVIPTIAPYYLPQMMARMQQRFAGLEVTLREAMTQTLLAELDDGRLDAAILALPQSAPHLAQTPLFAEDFVLVRPIGEATRPIPSPASLREMRLLLLEEGHCFRDQALEFCALQPSARPREVMDGSSLTTLVQMVAAGMGVTLIPDMAVPVETRAAAVCIQRFAPPAPARQIGMVWRKTSPLAPQWGEIAAALQG